MDDDEIAALLDGARAESERRATLTSADVLRVRSSGARHVLVDVVRMVPLVITLALVFALGKGTGFF